MVLGDLLARVERADAGGHVAALLGDLSLMTRVAVAATHEGVDADGYIMAAVRRFEREASGEEWTTLMGKVARHDDPASACLRYMVERVLSASGRSA